MYPLNGTVLTGEDKNYIAYNVFLTGQAPANTNRPNSCVIVSGGDPAYTQGRLLIEHNIASTIDTVVQHFNPFLRADVDSTPFAGSLLTVKNNIIWRWVDKGPLSGGGWVYAGYIDWQSNNRYYNAEFQPVNSFGFPHPDYTINDYMNAQGWTGENYVNFLDRAALQQKGRWDQRLTAPVVNDWFRTVAFGEPAFTPPPILMPQICM